MKILHLDSNHPILAEKLAAAGFENELDHAIAKADLEKKIANYDGIIIRSRFTIDSAFLRKATRLKFIGRVGAGLENIDLNTAKELNITCFNAPEGNRNAVGEHALGMILNLFNKLNKAHREVQQGIWDREGNRGLELEGKTVALIGYGNMGKSLARKLSGFNCEVICYDIQSNVGDEHAQQVTLKKLQLHADVLSLHTPQTPLTIGMVDREFIAGFKKPFYLINTARGKSVVTEDLVEALEQGKILGAGLDVLEYEQSSFESLFRNLPAGRQESEIPTAFKKLLQMPQVLLSPHVAGWSVESNFKLADVIASKIIANFKPKNT